MITPSGGYSNAIASKDAGVALTWAASISDEKLRDHSVQNIATEWLSRDPAAAKSWIQSSSLPEAQKTQLLTATPGG